MLIEVYKTARKALAATLARLKPFNVQRVSSSKQEVDDSTLEYPGGV